MSHSARRITAIVAVVTAAGALSTPAYAATSKAEKKQNTLIKKAQKTGTSAGKKATSAGKSAASAGTAAGNAAAAAGAATALATKGVADAKTANDGVAGILANVPAILTALTQLKDGLTAAGAGLTKLGDFVGADEYGIVQVTQGAGAGTAIPGCFYESADIPDNVQDAIVSGKCLIPSSVTAGTALHFLVGIRSNETDGTGAALPVGAAGIVAYTQTVCVPGCTAGGGGATSPSGAGMPPAVDIPTRSAMTSTTETSFPFGPISTDSLVDLATTQFTGTPATPVVANTGGVTVDFTIRFNDLSPDATNPKA